MKIGLIDVDGHNFPNLALMRISAYHKARGDTVEWWGGDLFRYDVIYKTKVFSDAYTRDIPDPINCGKLIKGGTGYAISLQDGKERYCPEKDGRLPPEIEKQRPDYSIYPQFNFAVSLTSRGCPRACSFCHVAAKEGRKSVKVADLDLFYDGQNHIECLDPNILACKDKRDLLAQYRALCVPRKGPSVTFNQGLDIRLMNGNDIDDINAMRIKNIHFAWDNPAEDLERHFKEFSAHFRRKHAGTVYVLTNYNSTMEENLYRIYTLAALGYDPFVMVYDKPHAPREIRQLQRWCNNKFIFKSCRRFEDYLT